jgi:large subunit ribosomal protein L23
MLSAHDVLIKPLQTEKTSAREQSGLYTFQVNVHATKYDVRQAIEQTFKVSVVGVRTITVRGHSKRTNKGTIKKPNWKKAYIQLAPDNSIDFLEKK